eukprot:2169681-Prymnesium_polylepis.2
MSLVSCERGKEGHGRQDPNAHAVSTKVAVGVPRRAGAGSRDRGAVGYWRGSSAPVCAAPPARPREAWR